MHVHTPQRVKETDLPCWRVKTRTTAQDVLPRNSRYAYCLHGMYEHTLFGQQHCATPSGSSCEHPYHPFIDE